MLMMTACVLGFVLPLFDAEIVGDLVSDGDVLWRSERSCGVNALYMLRRLNGVECDFAVLHSALVKDELASLNDIRVIATKIGCPVSIRKLSPAELQSYGKPILVHLEAVDIRGALMGHFIVVTQVFDDHVDYLDGTTAEPLQMTRRDFEREWSGFAATLPESRNWGSVLEMGMAFCVGVGGSMWIRRISDRRGVNTAKLHDTDGETDSTSNLEILQ